MWRSSLRQAALIAKLLRSSGTLRGTLRALDASDNPYLCVGPGAVELLRALDPSASKAGANPTLEELRLGNTGLGHGPTGEALRGLIACGEASLSTAACSPCRLRATPLPSAPLERASSTGQPLADSHERPCYRRRLCQRVAVATRRHH